MPPRAPRAPRPELPLVARARAHADRSAISAGDGTFTYRELLDASAGVANCLLAGRADLAEARVAFLAPAGFRHVATQWGIWRAGGVAVPLAVSHPPPELEYVIRDAEAEIVVVHPDLAGSLEGVRLPPTVRTVTTHEAAGTTPHSPLPGVAEGRRAMVVYTSGTTGRPKGVVTTHANLVAQVTSLVAAWEWRSDDHILLVLPLHHVHGIVNVLSCALWSGARCEMLPQFDAVSVWSRLAAGELTLFMAVPAIYNKLIAAWEAAPPERRRAYSAGCAPPRMRLLVSGSAAIRRDGRRVPRRLVPHRGRRRDRERRLPHTRAPQRGHHQDGGLQGLGARDRGGAAYPSCRARVRRRGRGRSRVGRAGVRRRRAARHRRAHARGVAGVGETAARGPQGAAGPALRAPAAPQRPRGGD